MALKLDMWAEMWHFTSRQKSAEYIKRGHSRNMIMLNLTQAGIRNTLSKELRFENLFLEYRLRQFPKDGLR